MQLIDTHVHIKFPEYDEDRKEMMQRAFNAGVSKMVHACCNTEEMRRLEELAREYQEPKLFFALGVHPIELATWQENSIELMRDFYQKSDIKDRIVAIGECGLDYYHHTEPDEQKIQRDIFQAQIDLAKELSLPIIVHTRDAWQDTLDIIEKNYPKTSDPLARSGVIHCYTGDYDFAAACIARGFYISWSGIVSFKNTPELREVAKKLPLERTLVETDCPFLAPQAKRGKRNEPSFVNYVADCLATVKELEIDEICVTTTKNAENLFGI